MKNNLKEWYKDKNKFKSLFREAYEKILKENGPIEIAECFYAPAKFFNDRDIFFVIYHNKPYTFSIPNSNKNKEGTFKLEPYEDSMYTIEYIDDSWKDYDMNLKQYINLYDKYEKYDNLINDDHKCIVDFDETNKKFVYYEVELADNVLYKNDYELVTDLKPVQGGIYVDGETLECSFYMNGTGEWNHSYKDVYDQSENSF